MRGRETQTQHNTKQDEGGEQSTHGGESGPKATFFFRPTPCGFRQVVQQLSKPVANDINYLIRTGANAVVAAKVNWKRTDT